MKQLTACLLALLLTITVSGCTPSEKAPDGKMSVVCTIFPQYDWVLQILGDKADDMNLTLLLNRRIDLHSYQPSVDDIIKISACDLFIYVGGESDAWVGDALKDASNPNRIVINLLDTLGDSAKMEEILEGMEPEDPEEEEPEYDEHVWLSLKNARVFCSFITDALSSLDASNAAEYQNNLAVYTAKLTVLDAEYQKLVYEAPIKTLLFGDRFPFRYLMDDYGLSSYAAFPGCSAETEASFKTIVSLSEKVDELNLKTIMVTESADQSIAKTIISNTKSKDQKILVLSAMQSVSESDIQNGTTYLSIMENNLDVLKDALK